MTTNDEYAFRGGAEGRERLRVLARVLRPTTSSLLDRVGIREGMTCLDVGCGGGDVTVLLADRVGPGGRVVGIDVDGPKIEVAREEARAEGRDNAEFRVLDLRRLGTLGAFDVVYARFVLTHLSDPDGAVTRLVSHIRPGGTLVTEDIDFGGSYTWPESDAYRRFHQLYLRVVDRRGGDPHIGRRLPLLLAGGGLEEVEMNVVQPMATRGDAKLLNPMTLENIADAAVRDGLASPEEIGSVVDELYRFAADPGTIAGLPRIVQAWGRRPPG